MREPRQQVSRTADLNVPCKFSCVLDIAAHEASTAAAAATKVLTVILQKLEVRDLEAEISGEAGRQRAGVGNTGVPAAKKIAKTMIEYFRATERRW